MTTQHEELHGTVAGWTAINPTTGRRLQFLSQISMNEMVRQAEAESESNEFFTLIKTDLGGYEETPGANPNPAPMGTPIGTPMVRRVCDQCRRVCEWFVDKEYPVGTIVKFICEDCSQLL